ncbi:MAG: type IX secretion system outer membrane channel protein PorV [Saprospiraceae bacterium]
MTFLLRLAPAIALIGLLTTTAFGQGLNSPCSVGDDGRFYNPDGSPCTNTVTSAVPFLRITPDARGGAMGDAGLALSADANAMHYNASRLAFAEDDFSIGATYTPWLQALGLNDVYLAYLGGYRKLNDLQTVSASLRYFSLGDIQYTDDNGSPLGIGKPNEFEVAIAYSRKLSDRFSASRTGKYINSNLAAGQQVNSEILEAGRAFAADVGFSYRNDDIRTASGGRNSLAFGVALTNLGNKISYTRDTIRDFLPANLGIGAAYTFELNEFNTITLTGDLNKLLVPTPCQGTDCDDIERRNQSPVRAILSSFGDAPEGFSEELKEITYSVGAEYWYDEQFAVRAGYFHENIQKGGRRYLTAGLGLKYNIFGLNFSYLVPTSNQRNPLDNTLRFSLIFDFGALMADE